MQAITRIKNWRFSTNVVDDGSNTFSAWPECTTSGDSVPPDGNDDNGYSQRRTFTFFCVEARQARFVAIERLHLLEIDEIRILGDALGDGGGHADTKVVQPGKI